MIIFLRDLKAAGPLPWPLRGGEFGQRRGAALPSKTRFASLLGGKNR